MYALVWLVHRKSEAAEVVMDLIRELQNDFVSQMKRPTSKDRYIIQ